MRMHTRMKASAQNGLPAGRCQNPCVWPRPEPTFAIHQLCVVPRLLLGGLSALGGTTMVLAHFINLSAERCLSAERYIVAILNIER